MIGLYSNKKRKFCANLITWTITLNVVSMVELAPQGAVLTIGTDIVKEQCYCIFIVFSGERLGPLDLLLSINSQVTQRKQ